MEEPTFDFQKVGEMFVMQYYTQMHRDPEQMYKFFQDTSSFVHGGFEIGRGEIVNGRQAIREKIMSLNLQQVHTKIRQVDSHPSIPNEVGASILIQVTGELSVAREVMRPFVQTFVLAQESPRKFFIYNDIFRYQLYDEDMDTETELQQENQSEVVIEQRPLSKEARSPSVPDDTHYHSGEQTLPLDLAADKRSPVPLGSAAHSDVIHESTGGSWGGEQFGDPQSNGLPEEAHVTLGEEPSYPLDVGEEENTTPIEGDADEGSIKEDISEDKTQPPPGTWAARISQNISKTSQPQQPFYNQQPISKAAQSPRMPAANQPLPQREPKPVKKPERPPEKKPFTPVAQVTSRTAPDSHQVFVGGLPTNTTESDLKSVFSQFGKIIEIRVNPKNFGFVVFDNEQSVRNVMASKDESPLTLRDKRLNIEEKRQSAPKGGMGMGPSLGRKAPLRPSNNRPQRRT